MFANDSWYAIKIELYRCCAKVTKTLVKENVLNWERETGEHHTLSEESEED